MHGEFKENWIKGISSDLRRDRPHPHDGIDPCSSHCYPGIKRFNKRQVCKVDVNNDVLLFFPHLHIQGWIKQPLLNRDQRLTFAGGEIYTKLNLGKNNYRRCGSHLCTETLPRYREKRPSSVLDEAAYHLRNEL